MQLLFISKYNWEIEKDKNGNLVIITNKYIYDVAIKEENGNKYFTIIKWMELCKNKWCVVPVFILICIKLWYTSFYNIIRI